MQQKKFKYCRVSNHIENNIYAKGSSIAVFQIILKITYMQKVQVLQCFKSYLKTVICKMFKKT